MLCPSQTRLIRVFKRQPKSMGQLEMFVLDNHIDQPNILRYWFTTDHHGKQKNCRINWQNLSL